MDIALGYYVTNHLEPVVLCHRHEARCDYGRRTYWIYRGWNLSDATEVSWSEVEAERMNLAPITTPSHLKWCKDRAEGIEMAKYGAWNAAIPLSEFLQKDRMKTSP